MREATSAKRSVGIRDHDREFLAHPSRVCVPPRRGGKRPPIYMGPVRGTPYIWEQLADLEPPFLRKGVQDLRVALHIKRPSHTALILPPAGGSAKAKRY